MPRASIAGSSACSTCSGSLPQVHHVDPCKLREEASWAFFEALLADASSGAVPSKVTDSSLGKDSMKGQTGRAVPACTGTSTLQLVRPKTGKKVRLDIIQSGHVSMQREANKY